MAKKSKTRRPQGFLEAPLKKAVEGAAAGILGDLTKEVTGSSVTFEGGTRRSTVMPAYHTIPATGIRRLAQRYSLGTETYGEGNWKRSLESRNTAGPFLKDVYNHLVEHLLRLTSGVDPSDDHLAAAAWGLTVLMYAEEKFGASWLELIA